MAHVIPNIRTCKIVAISRIASLFLVVSHHLFSTIYLERYVATVLSHLAGDVHLSARNKLPLLGVDHTLNDKPWVFAFMHDRKCRTF